MGDFLLLLLHSRRSGSKNEQAEFGRDQKHSRGSACKILFLHNDICATEMNAGRNHHGSSRNPSRSSSLIKSQLPILVLFLVVQVLLASHFPSPAQAQGAVAAPELLQSRALLQQISSNKIDSNSNGFRALDAKSDRIDPLDHFRKYKAGYDLKSKHYWASVIFTGIYGYAIAAAWVLLGLLLSLLVCFKSLLRWRRRRARRSSSCRSKTLSRAPASYSIPRLVVVLLSTAAIGCIVALYVSIQEFKSQTTDVEDVVLEAAQNATDSIHTVSAQIASVETILQPYSSPSFVASLNSIENTLSEQANDVESKVLVNKKKYKHVVDIMDYIHSVVVWSMELFLCGFLFLTFVLVVRYRLLSIIVMAWIMTTLTWVAFGIFYAAHNVGSDTCVSLHEYLQNPVNTTLAALLPCAALASANRTYLEARIGIDTVIRTQNVTFMTYAEGITSLTGLCDPIGPAPDYTYTGICPNTTLPIGDLQEVIAPLVCNNTNPAALSPSCTNSGKLITENENATFTDLSQAGQAILNIFPLIDGLTNCSFVTDTVSIIVTQKCKPANAAIDHLWNVFLVLSSLMIFLIAFWDVANRLNSQRHYLATIIPQDRGSSPDSSPNAIVK
ncbi:unnamed protein product [Sphagnum balticum]